MCITIICVSNILRELLCENEDLDSLTELDIFVSFFEM
jgi:hypothetical protein